MVAKCAHQYLWAALDGHSGLPLISTKHYWPWVLHPKGTCNCADCAGKMKKSLVGGGKDETQNFGSDSFYVFHGVEWEEINARAHHLFSVCGTVHPNTAAGVKATVSLWVRYVLICPRMLVRWRGGSIGRASDSRSNGPRFESRQEHKKKWWVFFRVKKCCADSLSVCPNPRLCIRTYKMKNDHVCRLKMKDPACTLLTGG